MSYGPVATLNPRSEPRTTDEAFDAYNAERLRAAGSLLAGRTTYEGFKGFWPAVVDDPNATPTQRATGVSCAGSPTGRW
jgi:dihydrofolate reductase